MASPFPGMDPYLEAATRWPGVHHHLLSAIAETLGDTLAPAFVVAVEERVYIATPGDLLRMPSVQPDVFLVEASNQAPQGTGAVAITPPLLIEPLEEEQVRERYLEILDAETRAVVTTIELLSPANKATGTTGRKKFLYKRRRILASRTHWVEIDLLRVGERPAEVQGRGSYYALLHRGEAEAPYEVWVAMLRERLPVIAVPTHAPLLDTPLDLQAMIELAYRRGHYDIAINYDAPVPAPPLGADDAGWARERIVAWEDRHANG
ncbi:MAG: DUF4058 family protein [Herpetosiphonaceae bacterium]|nr:DUF4058 family protein [Herpetosiphonaceae bacterium]